MGILKKRSDRELNQHQKWMPVLICLALVILAVIAFSPIKDAGFINFDDNIYVYENAFIKSGLNGDSIQQAFSFEMAKKSGHWHPVTWLSWLIDHSLFGLNPWGYHLINLLLHILNTVLLFLILRRMTKAIWPCAFVAALFAIHPLHVESVAWVTERKDVLSTFFWMLTIGAYSYYVEQREFKRYVFVLLFFVLGLMSKSMLVTLPFVLLLLDYWPLNRFSEIMPERKIQPEGLKPVISDKQRKKSRKKAVEKDFVKGTPEVEKPAAFEPKFKWSLIYPLLLEKIPLFLLSILSSIASYIAAESVGTVAFIEMLPLDVRIGNAFVSYVAYVGKMILPINLAIFYPHPERVILWQVLGAVSLLIAITMAVFWMFKRGPYLITGWLWYLGTLVPVIGIVQAGVQAMADRYTYIPLIGLFIILAWSVPELLKKWEYRKEILWGLSGLCILCLSVVTWMQVGYWSDSVALFSHTLKITDNNWLIYNSRGNAYYDLGNYRLAVDDFDKAIEFKPDYATAYSNRGAVYNHLGNYKKAIEDFDRAIKIKPIYAEAYNNRGSAHKGLGNYKQAIEDFRKAIEIEPDIAEFYKNRGVVYIHLGYYQQAIEDCNRALEMQPAYAEAHFNRGNAYFTLGNYRQAIEDYNRTTEIRPDFADAYNNRGLAYAGLGDQKQAVNDLKAAARLGDERARNVLKRQGIIW